MKIGVVGRNADPAVEPECRINLKSFVNEFSGIYIQRRAFAHHCLDHILRIDQKESHAHVETAVEETLPERHLIVEQALGLEIGIGGLVHVKFAQVGRAETLAETEL